MRVYQVTASGFTRYASTQADARATRDELAARTGAKPRDVKIQQTDIPTAKAELLEFVNELCERLDPASCEEGE